VEAEEGAAYGAALLAGVGGDVWKTVDDACDAVVRVKSRFSPDPAAATALAAAYQKFRALYPALKAVR
jgi:xylulokinase